MCIEFTQVEIEQELSDTIPHGMRKAIARITGIYPAIVSAYFSPDNERKSPMYETLAIQAALDQENPEVGEAHWKKFCALREASLPARFERFCLATEFGKGVKEDADVAIAAIENKPLYEQLTEVLEAIAQKERQKQAIVEAIALEKESFNGGTTRYASRGPELRRAARQTIRDGGK